MRLTLNLQIILAAVGGLLFGFILTLIGRESAFSQYSVYICGLIGKIFVTLLKMILIPLVFTSITVGIANLRAHAQMQRVWQLTLIYFLSSTTLAILLGLVVVNVTRPGAGLEISMFQESMQNLSVQDMSAQKFTESLLTGLFLNPFEAMAQGQVLPTIMFAIFLGISLVVSGEKSKTVLTFLKEFLELIMLIVGWIMKVLPIGIFCLLTKLVATQDPALFSAMGKFMLIVIGATLFHGFVVLPLLLVLFSKTKLSVYFKGVREALITAFSTSSSSATLPVTIRCMDNNFKVNKNISGFVLPLGATVNMDGTALYEAVAAIFVANLVGIELNFAQQVIVFFTAMVASIGAPGIPSAGMVTMVMVLQSVGLPVEAIAILLPIDRPLDAVRTMVNVEGDTIATLIVDHHTSGS